VFDEFCIFVFGYDFIVVCVGDVDVVLVICEDFW